FVTAQTPWATLESPPSGVAPPGEVLRPGHLGREIGNVELIIHFYHDLLGLSLRGSRSAPRPFGSKDTNPALLEFVEIGQGVPNPMDARNRAIILSIPGTAPPGGGEMAIEAIEIKNIESHSYKPLMSDPGVSYLKLFVKDLDETLTVLKNELVPVITIGEEPIELTEYPGLDGTIRAVFVRDPDGYPVALMESEALSKTEGSDEGNIVDARVSLVVDDLEETCRWFQHLVGPDFQFWASDDFMGNNAYTAWTGVREPFRMAMAVIPGSSFIMEFLEYNGHKEDFVRPYIQDPGTAHILFMSRDVDIVMPRLKSAGLHTLSLSDAPVFIGPSTRSFFVPNPDGFWAEFMDHGVKNKPE
ncbi:MAG: hypothetical protein P8Z37_14395, partial [Acidobacteriota bacterium]